MVSGGKGWWGEVVGCDYIGTALEGDHYGEGTVLCPDCRVGNTKSPFDKTS